MARDIQRTAHDICHCTGVCVKKDWAAGGGVLCGVKEPLEPRDVLYVPNEWEIRERGSTPAIV